MIAMPHNVGDSINQARDGTINWGFIGDRLVCHLGGGGWTRLSEYQGRKLIFRQDVPSEMAVKIAEDFTGKVVWK